MILSYSYSQDKLEVEIKDSTLYDIGFINYWIHLKPYSLKITNDSIILNKEYHAPILIPTDLPLNQESYYEFKSNDTLYQLTVKRVSYTNIKYLIQGKMKNEVFFSREGKAILESSFYLGSEGAYEKGEDEIYHMNKYNIENNELGEVKLLIPVGTDEVIDYIERQGQNKFCLSFNKIEK